MTYVKGQTRLVNWRFDYTIDNGRHKFERVQLHRDLGVIFDTELTFVVPMYVYIMICESYIEKISVQLNRRKYCTAHQLDRNLNT